MSGETFLQRNCSVDFVCTYELVGLGSNPKLTIYTFPI